MTFRLNASAPDFPEAFERFLGHNREADADVRAVVAEIVASIRAEGDAALLRLTARFDRVTLTAERLRVTGAEIDQAVRAVPAATLDALDLAARRITAYHEKQRPADVSFTDEAGIQLGFRWRPVAAAGLYVPGGTAAYPSSVLMNAIPAKVAGVGRLVMTVPAPDGVLNPLVLAAAARAGITEIYRVGGAQAVAALAYGTASIAPVDVIVGPGNAYVAEAKRQVFGQVGIDMIAGPSEILVLADADNDPDWVAADLLSQAEHDVAAQSILITDDAGFASKVSEAVSTQLTSLPRANIAGASWANHGAIILVERLSDAIPLIDRIAPEHLEILARDGDALAARIANAGAIFLDAFTPEPIGDYVAGTNHVLPTARSARYASGLSVFDFLKRTSLVKTGAAGLAAIGPAAVTLARAEGLEAHARAVALRLDRNRG
jgi:histidinol dehydrogenase